MAVIDVPTQIVKARKSMSIKFKSQLESMKAGDYKLNESQIASLCSICTLNFEQDQTVKVFACHETHMLHEECYNELLKFSKQKKVQAICPICREMIVETQVVTRKIQIEKDDPFNLG